MGEKLIDYTDYEFVCPKCKTKFKALDMPCIEVMKKIGHHITCPICGEKTSIIENYNSISILPAS